MGFKILSYGRFVGMEIVSGVEVFYMFNVFFVEVFGGGSGVEVEVICLDD